MTTAASEHPVAEGEEFSPRLTSPVLVGREKELGALLTIARTPPAVALIEGEAGVGKTRIVEELLTRLEHPARSLLGRCHEIREPFHLGPLVEALKVAGFPGGVRVGPPAGAFRRLLPELADRLPPEPERPDDPRAQRHLVYRGVREVLAALGPTVLVLEDLHWADEQTGELLRVLVSDLPNDLILILTYRGEELPLTSSLRGLAARLPAGLAEIHVELPRLDVEGVRALVGAILGNEEVSEEFATYLHERTSGLPFAVEEVLRLLRDRGTLVRRGESGGRGGPSLSSRCRLPSGIPCWPGLPVCGRGRGPLWKLLRSSASLRGKICLHMRRGFPEFVERGPSRMSCPPEF